MKLTAAILVTYISLISLSPALCGFYNSVKKIELCCMSNSNKDCSSNISKNCTSSSNENEEDDSPCTPCCGIPNCNCFYEKIPAFNFTVDETVAYKKVFLVNNKIFSSYFSECWNPPEIV